MFCNQLPSWLYQLELIKEAESLRETSRRGSYYRDQPSRSGGGLNSLCKATAFVPGDGS